MMTETEVDRRRQRLIAIGELLYGSRWRRQLAADLHVEQAYVSMIASGKRPVTDSIEVKLAAHCALEDRRRTAQATRLREWAVEMLAEQKASPELAEKLLRPRPRRKM